MPDPVFEKDGKWYFWDEVWFSELGPWENEEEARQKLDEYCEYLGRNDDGSR